MEILLYSSLCEINFTISSIYCIWLLLPTYLHVEVIFFIVWLCFMHRSNHGNLEESCEKLRFDLFFIMGIFFFFFFFVISLLETAFCRHIIKNPIIPSLPSKGTLCSTYTAVTLVCDSFPPWKPAFPFILHWPCAVMGVAPIWFIETSFSVELTYKGKLRQYIPLYSSSLWLNKLQERLLSSRRITDHTTMIAKKWLWHYQ